jgi:hypothetical protein
MDEKTKVVPVNRHKNGCMFARFDDGHWYAILPDMADAFRKKGAVVSALPDGVGVEEVPQEFLR